MYVEVKDNSLDLKIKYSGSLDKNIFKSYKTVIESRVKAGRDVDRLLARLEHLLIENSK